MSLRNRLLGLTLINFPIFDIQSWYPLKLPYVMCNYNKSISASNGGYKHVVSANGSALRFKISANVPEFLRGIVIKRNAVEVSQKLILFGA